MMRARRTAIQIQTRSLEGWKLISTTNLSSPRSECRGEFLATGAVTAHIPELARFPTEGNILILLIPRETSLQTIEEALTAMLDEVNLNGPTVQRVCLTCYVTKSTVCRFCDLQSKRPTTATGASSLTAKPPQHQGSGTRYQGKTWCGDRDIRHQGEIHPEAGHEADKPQKGASEVVAERI